MPSSVRERVMRAAAGVLLFAALAAALMVAGPRRERVPSRAETALAPRTPLSERAPLYDPNAAHIWNRLDRLLRWRRASDGSEHGREALDPLLWRQTRHLVSGESHAAAIRLLDEFLASDAERLITDPLRRVVLQRDVWSVFDWAVSRVDHPTPERAVLAGRLARVIRRLAPTAAEASGLAVDHGSRRTPLDTYSAVVASGRFAAAYDPARRETPFLPPELMAATAAWVPVHGSAPVAQHAGEMSRSSFAVVLHVPPGRRATLTYLETLWKTPAPFVQDPFGSASDELRTTMSPELRAVPDGTQFALVRRMLFVDATGQARQSRIVESVQIRVYRRTDTAQHWLLGGRYEQDFFEFVLDRGGLFRSAAAALRLADRHDDQFLTFPSTGLDPFERPQSPSVRSDFQRCGPCHQAEGLASVQIAQRLFKPFAFPGPGQRAIDDRALAAWSKTQRADWGRLQAYWEVLPR